MKLNIITLAIKSCELSNIAENIGNLGIEMWQAERIINGLPEIDVEKLKAKVASENNREYISHEIFNALKYKECIHVTYRYPVTVYWNKEYHMPEDVKCVDREKFIIMYNKASCFGNKQDEYQYKMTYWETGSIYYAPEDL